MEALSGVTTGLHLAPTFQRHDVLDGQPRRVAARLPPPVRYLRRGAANANLWLLV
jgi:hypothetical protein